MPATFTTKFNFGYGWFLGEDPGVEPLDYQTKALDALVLDAFGQDVATTAGLTYGYRGGWLYNTSTRLPFRVNGGTVLLPANTVNYVQRNASGVVSFGNAFTLNSIPMAIVTTNNFEIVSVEDARTVNGAFPNLVSSVFGRIGDVVAVSGDYAANLITLSQALDHYPSAANVQEALELMDTDIALSLSQGVHSFGPPTGPARTGYVFTQYGDYAADIIAVDEIPGLDLSAYAFPTVQDALNKMEVQIINNAAAAKVDSFNTRTGDVVPLFGDYSAALVEFSDVIVPTILIPASDFGNNVQTALDVLKEHYHDATQIVMNPVIVPGKDTVQKMLQWLFDNLGVGGGGLTITASDYVYVGSLPHDVTLNFSVSGGTGPYDWEYVSGTIPGDPADNSSIGSGSSQSVTINGVTAGAYTATIKVTDSLAATTTTTLNVTLSATGSAPVISSFLASPGTITVGNSSTLSWSVSGATSLSINQGVGTVTGTTNHSVSPSTTTTYTLTATNAYGSSTANVTVNVNAATLPVINSFICDPNIAIYNAGLGYAVTALKANVSNYTSLSVDHSVGDVTSTITTPSGTTVHPTATTTYTLTATNSAGSVTATATCTVGSLPSITFSATPSTFFPGEGDSVTLNWNVTNSTSVSINQGIGSVAASGTTSIPTASFPIPEQSTTWTLTATNAFGSTTSSRTALRVLRNVPVAYRWYMDMDPITPPYTMTVNVHNTTTGQSVTNNITNGYLGNNRILNVTFSDFVTVNPGDTIVVTATGFSANIGSVDGMGPHTFNIPAVLGGAEQATGSANTVHVIS